MNLFSLMYVAIGGAVGSMCRYMLLTLIMRFNHTDFPYGTLIVNVFGSFIMGVWIAAMATMMPARARELHLLFAVGVLGGFTTFSTFSVDVFLLFERGMIMQGSLYILGSVGLSLAGLIAGMWCLKVFAA